MAILIGKSRPGVNIIICGTSAGAAAHRTASAAAAWKSTKAAGEKWSGEPFVLPARIRRHVGRGNRRGSGGRVSIRRGPGGGRWCPPAATSWSSPGLPAGEITCFPRGLPKSETSWGQVIKAPVSTTNGSFQRVEHSGEGGAVARSVVLGGWHSG